MQGSKLGAVLTGDIINSRKLNVTQKGALHERLVVSAEYSRTFVHPQTPEPCIDIFRGDGWQVYVSNPVRAFAAAICLRAYLKGSLEADTRVSIGIGAIQNINHERISTSSGEAFVLSGSGLEQMPDGNTFACRVCEPLRDIEPFLQSTVTLADPLLRNWTAKQAFASALTYQSLTHEELGKQMPRSISKATFGQHLAAASWKYLRDSIDFLEKGLQQRIQGGS